MKGYAAIAALFIAAATMAGCGSSDSNSGTSTVLGKVADGYLENAVVFMDKNGNYRPDAGEPTTTTGAGGGYLLTVDTADIGQYPIVALAIQGQTVDSDNPGVPIAHSYLMSLGKESVSGTVSSNFISPISTQLREMMETRNYGTVQEAMEALRQSLGMPAGTDMMVDYIQAQNTRMHTAAQNMARVMGDQAPLLFRNYSGANRMDVNRYRAMMGTMFCNMSSVRTANTEQTMTQLMNTFNASVGSVNVGMPFVNMSTFFRGGRMGR